MTEFSSLHQLVPTNGLEAAGFSALVNNAGIDIGCEKIQVFGYGSNSIAQLKGRITTDPEQLRAQKATLHGWERIFAGSSSAWGRGAVASLHPMQSSSSSMAVTMGSAVLMTVQQLLELFKYEGGYAIVPVYINLQTGGEEDDTTVNVCAFTFIRRDHIFHAEPNEVYLTAIHHHLSSIWIPEGKDKDNQNSSLSISIEIVGYNKELTRTQYHAGWRYPSAAMYNLPIPALLVSANFHRVKGGSASWTMPKTVVQLTDEFRHIGIHGIAFLLCTYLFYYCHRPCFFSHLCVNIYNAPGFSDLSVALHNLDNMNQALISKGFDMLTACTTAALLRLMEDANNASQGMQSEEEEEDGNDDSDTVLCFVYGSLMSKLHNFHLMEKHDAVFVGKANTLENYYMSSRLPELWFPYVSREPILNGQCKTSIQGEVYRVPKRGLGDLDRLENHPWWYRRQKIQARVLVDTDPSDYQGTLTTVSIYIFENSKDITDMRSNQQNFLAVDDGDWRKCLLHRTTRLKDRF